MCRCLNNANPIKSVWKWNRFRFQRQKMGQQFPCCFPSTTFPETVNEPQSEKKRSAESTTQIVGVAGVAKCSEQENIDSKGLRPP